MPARGTLHKFLILSDQRDEKAFICLPLASKHRTGAAD
ncbi:hypothetical protein ACZ87_01113 [Candidatus Erwinia dacicola]|uniref:Uncharacterized protein n=1 Tax=Candidatus Erwinia dacicola TaxID=252393 RepID=A0A328TN83_9GAMM|nr:hypothetical protein ACZ87_01113 [Candidatus Erwinia dacicola]